MIKLPQCRAERIEDFHFCVGMLKSIWRNKQTQESQYMDHGTAFAVSPQMILTCTHNIYHEEEDMTADEVVFVPNHSGNIREQTRKYYAMPGKYFEFIGLNQEEGETLRVEPTRNELCLIALSEPIPGQQFIRISQMHHAKGNISIVGYPSKDYSRKTNLMSVHLKRQHLKGRILSINDHTINHSLETKAGQSGSPIFYKTPTNEVIAIGIHTHKGENENKGLFFAEDIINLIKSFENQLIARFNLSASISYFSSMKQNENLNNMDTYLKKIAEIRAEISSDHHFRPQNKLTASFHLDKNDHFFEIYQIALRTCQSSKKYFNN